ncbi:CHAT domain-containing protein [Armatimonas sp.]|uniref:CHAT domain-containing protein n=1 Tax=Armatimonas sp. TaxID=1872638 RepID=UPI00374D040D
MPRSSGACVARFAGLPLRVPVPRPQTPAGCPEANNAHSLATGSARSPAPADALHQAHRALQQSGKWRHPHYWAGFSLIGTTT